MMSRRRVGWAAAAVGLGIAMAAAACGGGTDEPAGTGGTNGSKVAKSELSRDTAPQVADTDRLALADGNAAFAADLYGQLHTTEPGNFIYSPFSTSIALAMTYAGAQGATESQMAGALHFTLSQDKLHPAFNQVDLALLERNKAADPANGKGFRLHVANSLWGQVNYEFNKSFLDSLAVNYGAGLQLADFVSDVEGARQEINGWVSQNTDSKINDLIPAGVMNSDTRLVLTNAIYFNASWKDPFKEAYTSDAPFTKVDNAQVTVKMMETGGGMPYGYGDGYEIVQLPYQGDQVAMTLVLPEAGRFAEIEGKFASGGLKSALDGLLSASLNVELPKFKFTSEFKLSDALKALGMTDAFVKGTANFKGMNSDNLFVQEVLHKAFIGVDEKGTEAAAATAVVMGADASMGPPPKTVTFNRPFLFLIRDLPTQSILFAGRVVDPTS